MKKNLILLFVLIIGLIILGSIIFKTKSVKPEIANKQTLYTLNNVLNENFSKQHPELQDLQQVYYYNGNQLIAKTNKVLDKNSFVILVNDLIENGYVLQGAFNQIMEIKDRNIKDELDSITIIDTGINTIFNDVPPFETTYREIILEYKYDKNSGNIYFIKH